MIEKDTEKQTANFFPKLASAIASISFTLICYAIAWKMIQQSMIMSTGFMVVSLLMMIGLITSFVLSSMCTTHPRFKNNPALKSIGLTHWMTKNSLKKDNGNK